MFSRSSSGPYPVMFPTSSDAGSTPELPLHTGFKRRSSGGTITSSFAQSLSEKYSLSEDPAMWGSAFKPDQPEPDDALHNPADPEAQKDLTGSLLTSRGLSNLGCLAVLILLVLGLFAGYPVTSYFTSTDRSTFGAFNIGGLNASGQVPVMMGNRGLIDVDTPSEAYFKEGYYDTGGRFQLVFSDEFNVEGRTFFPGDDPFWEAVDLHYWGTNNEEWYDPAAVTTRDGAMEITLSRKRTHDLDYEGGMVSTWNKFCATGGLVEVSVMLPGSSNVQGLWPAAWMMGNLGRAGYGASLEGTWPYTYDACDVGTAPNQTLNGLPAEALTQGDQKYGGTLSYLPGQRLSRCTCPGEEHPGPIHADGSFVGRAAPEIDFFEAQVSADPDTGVKQGHVSQSGQFAPFNVLYQWENISNAIIPDPELTELNGFKGNVFQQAMSGVSLTDQNCYEFGGTACFSVYGIEYKQGFDDAYITWINDNKHAWTMLGAGAAADPVAQISARPIPQEPMYIIMNLGMSLNFGEIEFDVLEFPTKMRIDWIRYYQREDQINIGCDPKEFPTRAYIERFPEAYSNPNFTTWVDDYGQRMPKNSFIEQCDPLP